MRVYAVVSEQMSDEALELFVNRHMAELMVKNCDRDADRLDEAIDLSRRVSMRILEGVASVAFVYYGATRGVTEQQALFLADGLEGRYAASPVALRLAKRIREEAAARRAETLSSRTWRSTSFCASSIKWRSTGCSRQSS